MTKNQGPSDNEQILKLVVIVATAIIGIIFMTGCGERNEDGCIKGSTWDPSIGACVTGETTPEG